MGSNDGINVLLKKDVLYLKASKKETKRIIHLLVHSSKQLQWSGLGFAKTGTKNPYLVIRMGTRVQALVSSSTAFPGLEAEKPGFEPPAL